MNAVNIDKSAGFCWGVLQTIEKVENTIDREPNKNIYVIGEIIHNPHEIERLAKRNLKTIDYTALNEIDSKNSIVIIRAHGEPPSTYNLIEKLDIPLIDATCPLVKRLQEKIIKYYNNNYQIIIFGKKNHPEVIGLSGFCNNECFVVRNIDELKGKINYSKQTMLCSQTTMDVNSLAALHSQLCKLFSENGNAETEIIFERTVCKFMINREEELKKFAKQNELIIFVAGKHSSNGKVLFDICKKVNNDTIFVENGEEIDIASLNNYKSIGITGATSTPKWFLEEISSQLFSDTSDKI